MLILHFYLLPFVRCPYLLSQRQADLWTQAARSNGSGWSAAPSEWDRSAERGKQQTQGATQTSGISGKCCWRKQVKYTGTDAGFPLVGGGTKRLCTRTHITNGKRKVWTTIVTFHWNFFYSLLLMSDIKQLKWISLIPQCHKYHDYSHLWLRFSVIVLYHL